MMFHSGKTICFSYMLWAVEYSSSGDGELHVLRDGNCIDDFVLVKFSFVIQNNGFTYDDNVEDKQLN